MMASRHRQHRPRHMLPFSDPERTVALWLVRWSDSPDDPLRIALDHALLDRLGWRPGDRITFEPIGLDRRTREGGLIVRRADPDEPAITLEAGHYERHRHPFAHAHFLPIGPDGPNLKWPCPPEWIETFFPQEYLPGPGSPIFVEPDRSWLLSSLLDHRERVVVSLGCSLLSFYLQRTDPVAAALDVHLSAGVLHLMGWSPSTSLDLTSASGFDPSAPDDILTIRRASPQEANLSWDGARFLCSPNPTWLDRYFPGLHDNTEEVLPQNPGPMPADPDHDHDDPDVVKFPGQEPPDREFEQEERDTFCVHYRDFQLGQDSLSFAIPETSHVWD